MMLWYESPVAGNLSVMAKCHVTLAAFRKFIFFLLTPRPTRHTKLEIFSEYFTKIFLKLDRSSALNPTSTFRKSTSSSPPLYASRLLSVGLNQKRVFYSSWYLWCEENNARRSHACVLIIFICLEAPHFTAAVHWMWVGQNKTETSRKCVLSDMRG